MAPPPIKSRSSAVAAAFPPPPPPPPPPPASSSAAAARRSPFSLHKTAITFAALLLLLLLSAQILSTSCRSRSPFFIPAPSSSSSSSFWPSHHSSSSSSSSSDLHLLHMERPWNELSLHSDPSSLPFPKLRIAAFVRKWPWDAAPPGGLERHALTLHRFLADRGHDVHVFTAGSGGGNATSTPLGRLIIHRCGGGTTYSPSAAWAAFRHLNATSRFHILHSESVALHHTLAAGLPNVVASWHGIAFEVVHTDIVSELLRPASEPRPALLQKTLEERLLKVAEEVRFFGSYRHHVAISDHVGEVLRTVYELEGGRVHVILNGVDERKYRPEAEKGEEFRKAAGVRGGGVVMGVAGRLVKDKGHPMLVEALKKILGGSGGGRCPAEVLVAGDGPWAARYREMAPCVIVVGVLDAQDMASFYNAIDVFVNPTLRAQGLDLTLVEAMMCGKPVVATRFSSITRSVVVDPSLGYTFSPNPDSLFSALRSAISDGRSGALASKGAAARRRASRLFTASRMGLAYERLFLCITYPHRFCRHPLQPADLHSSS